ASPRRVERPRRPDPACGDIQLVFRNPDLQPGSDGIIRASGQFFVQFQAIGEQADRIATFGFSFGPDTIPFDESVCSQPLWVTGTYIPNYRADRDPTDGFFIPLKTSLVPDGAYAAAVHAYDAQNNELARFWARAVVDNCDGGEGSRCDGDVAQMTRQDKTAPWPIVLPGDGEKPADHQMTIEFGEPLSGLRVLLNGEDVTGSLTEIPGRLWDADLVPDHGPGGLSGVVAEPCTMPAPAHQCTTYGPAYALDMRALTDDDVVRVEATDLANNTAVKTIHLGSSVAGGAITEDAPILGYTVDRTEATAPAGGLATFRFQITNSGGGTGHPFASATGPEGWQLRWDPVHVVVPPGATVTQELTVQVPPTEQFAGTVTAVLTYQQGGTEKALRQDLTVRLGETNPNGPAATVPGDGPASTKDSPGLAPLAALAALAAAVGIARRR
ncbi:MAG TPA: hypothetical protein VFH47_08435, partial [Candidatus Thermoplasmatota archaeon]|nr:hypothetical protein [Candidatus Thermoplasmatota archaeon]